MLFRDKQEVSQMGRVQRRRTADTHALRNKSSANTKSRRKHQLHQRPRASANAYERRCWAFIRYSQSTVYVRLRSSDSITTCYESSVYRLGLDGRWVYSSTAKAEVQIEGYLICLYYSTTLDTVTVTYGTRPLLNTLINGQAVQAPPHAVAL